MKTIILTPKSKSELAILSTFLKKVKIEATYLTEEEKEELGLKILMKEADRKKIVSRSTLIRKLKSA